MSVAGIATSILSGLNGLQNSQSGFSHIRSEFQQLGQDLQSGNLTQAQQDFATLSQSLNPGSQTSNISSSDNSALAQAFNQLGQDLQSGNLQSAQQEFTAIQQDVQQTAAQFGARHHHHFASNSQNSSSSSSSIQPTNSIAQEFSLLAQTLQSGNLQGAQTAFSSLQADLQQIEGLTGSVTSGALTTSTSGSLNVTA